MLMPDHLSMIICLPLDPWLLPDPYLVLWPSLTIGFWPHFCLGFCLWLRVLDVLLALWTSGSDLWLIFRFPNQALLCFHHHHLLDYSCLAKVFWLQKVSFWLYLDYSTRVITHHCFALQSAAAWGSSSPSLSSLLRHFLKFHCVCWSWIQTPHLVNHFCLYGKEKTYNKTHWWDSNDIFCELIMIWTVTMIESLNE